MRINKNETDSNPYRIDPELSDQNGNPSSASIPDFQSITHEGLPLKEREFAWWKSVNLSKVFLFIASLYLFVLGITLMKDGASSVGWLIQEIFSISNPANSLGFGWLSAYLILSGSPVAASALTFFNAGLMDELSAYAMVVGSRLGASFIVLFIGYIYVLRGRDRATSLSMGLLSLTVTATTYLPSFLLGTYILSTGILDKWQIQSGVLLKAFFESAIYPVSGLAVDNLSEWAVFVLGLGVIMLSFGLFDKCLPQMALKESRVGQMSRLIYHPLVMFTLGALITMISMSVTLSLSILVPLSNRGFVRRENVIPYIMGANITTFIDTLFAAALLENSIAFTIVLTGMLSISIVSIIILLTFYRPYQLMTLVFVENATSSNRNIILFMIIIFVIPLFLIGFA